MRYSAAKYFNLENLPSIPICTRYFKPLVLIYCSDQMRISDLYNMDIYTDSGQFLGEVKDATVDLERGEVSRLLMIEWKAAGRESATKVLSRRAYSSGT